MADEVTYTKPTTQADLESFQAREAGEPDPQVGEARSWQVEGNETDAFLGVDQEYRNYANESHRPFRAEDENPEAKAEEVAYTAPNRIDAEGPDAATNAGADAEEVARLQAQADNATTAADVTEVREESNEASAEATAPKSRGARGGAKD